MLRYLTAGESHGPTLTAILEGMPAGLPLEKKHIDHHLRRRQVGYGRGGRMRIEHDHVRITSGVRWGHTLGSPISLMVANRDWENWTRVMAVDRPAAEPPAPVVAPRPGHADLVGLLKYDRSDARDILERASARETAARVAVGAICATLLSYFNITIASRVVQIGPIRDHEPATPASAWREAVERSTLRTATAELEHRWKEEIDAARGRGDTLGGVFEVVVSGAPPGLGSHVHWDRKLDGRLARALISIQAIKGVEFGAGFELAGRPGSQARDAITYDGTSHAFHRPTNHMGGLEGGMSNGEPIVVRAAMKPLPTISGPLDSVDLSSKTPVKAVQERSDVCAVPAASIVGEMVTAFELARVLCEKLGGDSLKEMKRNYDAYLSQLQRC